MRRLFTFLGIPTLGTSRAGRPSAASAAGVSPAEIEAESLRAAFRHYGFLSPICILAAVYQYAKVEAVPVGSYTLEWIVVCVTYHLIRSGCSLAFLRARAPTCSQLARWENVVWVLQFFDGLLILSFALWVWPLYAFDEQLILLMTILMTVSGTSFVLAGRWRIIAFFAPMAYLGFAWAAAWRVNHVYAEPVAITVLMFLGLYLFGARTQHRANVRGLALARELQSKNEQLQELASARSRLLATVSHDLRQPSHAIGLLCERALFERSPPALEQALRDLNELSHSLSASLTTLMDLTRLDAGLVQARPQPVALGKVLQRLDTEFSASARKKGLTLDMPLTDRWIHTDPVLLHGVVANLLSNAIKYTREGGVRLEISCSAQALTLSVCDTGRGIAPDKLEAIFKEFVRLDGADPGTEGLGLGLSIVRRYAALLDHPLQVQSQPGQGSCFSIQLPLVPHRDVPLVWPKPTTGGAGDARLSGLRVLVVDNVDLVLSSMVGTLQAWGCQVIAARSLSQARAQAGEHALDLVVTDFHLGDGEPDGLALIRALRQMQPRSDGAVLPALLMTGDVSASLEVQASRDEVGMLHKPVRPAVLQSALLNLLHHESINALLDAQGQEQAGRSMCRPSLGDPS
jgi:signal transduction histidine kinase/CheY-like chemotaxis protein